MSDPLQHFLIANVDFHEEIGRGVNSVVYRGSWQGAPCAVKTMEFSEIHPKDRERMKKKIMTECERSSALRHPNIVQFLGVHIAGDAFPSLVMERLHSNLTDLLIANPKVPIKIKFSFIHDVAKGLKYLHTYTPTIIHRDLSTNNVLVSTDMVAKIKLGVVHLLDQKRLSQMTREARTADFMPPEVLFDKPVYSTAMDVFSFACVCIHILSHRWPTPSQPVEVVPDSLELIPRSEAQRRAAYMEGIDDDIRSLATSCLSNSAEKRLNIGDVCIQLECIVAKQKFTYSLTLLDIEKFKEEIDFKDGQISLLQTKTNNFWDSLHVTRERCSDLLVKCWPTSVTELDGKVYIIAEDTNGATYTYVYNVIKGKWSQLPAPPHEKCSLVSVPDQKQLLAIGGYKKIRDAVEVSGQVFVWNEDNKKWLIKYPNMPTARFSSPSISHGIMVVVIGGVTCLDPWIVTSTVEILSIEEQDRTHWTKVEQLPYAVYDAIPLIIQDTLYIAGGFDKLYHGTCKIVTASLLELKKNDISTTMEIWSRLPDMPYSSFSINHYQGRLITFTGVSLGEQPAQDKPMHRFHLYNPDTKSWDYVATASEGYIWGRSVRIKEDVIFVAGGTTGTIYRGKDDNLVKTCLTMSFIRKGRIILHNAF